MIGVRWTCRKKRKRNKGGMKKAGRLWCGKEEKNMEDPNQEKKRNLIQNILLCYNA